MLHVLKHGIAIVCVLKLVNTPVLQWYMSKKHNIVMVRVQKHGSAIVLVLKQCHSIHGIDIVVHTVKHVVPIVHVHIHGIFIVHNPKLVL